MALADDQTELEFYIQCRRDILAGGQESSVPGRSLKLPPLKDVERMIEILQARIATATRGPILLGRPRR